MFFALRLRWRGTGALGWAGVKERLRLRLSFFVLVPVSEMELIVVVVVVDVDGSLGLVGGFGRVRCRTGGEIQGWVAMVDRSVGGKGRGCREPGVMWKGNIWAGSAGCVVLKFAAPVMTGVEWRAAGNRMGGIAGRAVAGELDAGLVLRSRDKASRRTKLGA